MVEVSLTSQSTALDAVQARVHHGLGCNALMQRYKQSLALAPTMDSTAITFSLTPSKRNAGGFYTRALVLPSLAQL